MGGCAEPVVHAPLGGKFLLTVQEKGPYESVQKAMQAELGKEVSETVGKHAKVHTTTS